MNKIFENFKILIKHIPSINCPDKDSISSVLHVDEYLLMEYEGDCSASLINTYCSFMVDNDFPNEKKFIGLLKTNQFMWQYIFTELNFVANSNIPVKSILFIDFLMNGALIKIFHLKWFVAK